MSRPSAKRLDPQADSAPSGISSARRRRRGGQPGNVNRLKHGFYSRRLPRALTASSTPRTGLDPDFEISLARVRLVQLIDQQKSAPDCDWLSYERGVLHYLSLIVSLIGAGVRRKRHAAEVLDLLRELPAGSGANLESGLDDSNLFRTSSGNAGDSRD